MTERTTLNKALGRARRLFAVVGLFSAFINLLMLVGPLYMLQVYDRVLASRSEDTLIALTGLAVGLIALGAFLELVRSRILVRLGARFDGDLNSRVFSALFSQQLHARSATGEQNLRDMNSLRGFLTGPGLTAFFDAPWTPAFIIVIFLFHPLLGAIALAGAICLFLLAVLSEFATRKPLQQSAEKMLAAHEFAGSALRNVEAIRAMGMLGPVRDRWQTLHSSGLTLQGDATDRSGALTAIVKFIRPCLQIAMLGFGAYLVIQEAITPGVMIAASIIMGRALAPVESAINNWRTFIAARGAYRRLQTVLQRNPEPGDALSLPDPTGKLQVENVTAMPPKGDKPILQKIDFALQPGQMLGVIGPSAAGKSTLARLLVGIWPPAAGTIRIDGAQLSRWPAEEIGRHIGYLPQDVELLSGSVAENIARMQAPDSEKVIAAARLCNAHEMILRLPDGYDTEIGEAGCVLSGGQRQRIALARALYDDPRLIVLDEPNANLDSDGEAALHETLKRLKATDRTVIIISHRPAVLTAVDLVMVLRDGQLDTFGPRDDVLRKLIPGVRPIRSAEKTTAEATGAHT